LGQTLWNFLPSLLASPSSPIVSKVHGTKGIASENLKQHTTEIAYHH